jgi:hypothetical protein
MKLRTNSFFMNVLYFLSLSILSAGCVAGGKSTGINSEDAEKIKNTTTAYVFYHNANSVEPDGSYQYQPEGRTYIQKILASKGYNVEFVGKFRQGTLFIEVIQNDGTQEYVYRTERVVGTYKDKNGNVVGTYNEPGTRSKYKSWTRVDVYVYDPKTTTEANSICHKEVIKNGSTYNIRYQNALSQALAVIPSKKKKK